MRVLLFGATGMLGQALSRVARARGIDLVGAARGGADVRVDLFDRSAILDAVADAAPDMIVNAAAKTDHDACEHDLAGAFAVNARAVAYMADAARARGCKLVQVSTDQFWSGDGDLAHAEDHPVSLLPGEYVRTKFAGEAFALTAPGALVVRTNITGLRGIAGSPTFIEWVFTQVESGEPFRLFDDYFTSTIDTDAFAHALLDLAAKDAHGLYHVASSEVSSKKDFILAAAQALTGRAPEHTTASVADLPTLRAESAGLAVAKAEAKLGRGLPDRAAVVAALADAWRNR